MAVRRQSLLAAAAALRAVAETVEDDATEQAEEQKVATKEDDSDKVQMPSSQIDDEASVPGHLAGGRNQSNQIGEETSDSALPTPPLPSNMEDLSRRLSNILRHRPRGCDFRIDGSAPLAQVAERLGVLPTVLVALAEQNPGPHRLPRFEIAVVEGQRRIRATFKHSYQAFDHHLLRTPMVAGTPNVWRSEDTNRTERNRKAHERKRARRDNDVKHEYGDYSDRRQGGARSSRG